MVIIIRFWPIITNLWPIRSIRYYFVDSCIRAGRIDLAQDAAQKILSVLARKTQLEPFELNIQHHLLRTLG